MWSVRLLGPSDRSDPDAGAGVRGGVPDGAEGRLQSEQSRGERTHAVAVCQPDHQPADDASRHHPAADQPLALAFTLGQRDQSERQRLATKQRSDDSRSRTHRHQRRRVNPSLRQSLHPLS